MKNLSTGIAIFVALTSVAHAAVSLLQIETFSALGGWSGGSSNPNPPLILADSGPLGTGDSAFKITSNGGSGAGGKLVVFNQTAWTGDFVTPGIDAITVDFKNLGTTTLSIRLAFNGGGGWFVTQAFSLAQFSGWNHSSFDIRPVSLESAGGSDAAGTMANVTEFRILHSSSASFKGSQISSSFLADNIQAVPEPAAGLLICLAGVGGFFRKR